MCPACGCETFGTRTLCEHHSNVDILESQNNRIMCDLVHRQKQPTRLAAEDRDPVSLVVEEETPPVVVEW